MYFFGLIDENKSTSEKEQPLRIKMTKMQEQEPDTLFQNRKRIRLTVIFDTLRYPPKPIIDILCTALKFISLKKCKCTYAFVASNSYHTVAFPLMFP